VRRVEKLKTYMPASTGLPLQRCLVMLRLGLLGDSAFMIQVAVPFSFLSGSWAPAFELQVPRPLAVGGKTVPRAPFAKELVPARES